jgi:DmsE family decaheme c-type cytochrome
VHHGKGSALVEATKAEAADLRGTGSPTGVTTTSLTRSLKAEEPVLCGKCHRREVGEFRHNFHHPVPEGRMQCSDCHELHPTKDTPRKAAPTKSACVNCHLETAGPFKYEHEPVAGWIGDGCIECHKPHGSHNPGLLNSFSRGLCAQCHSDLTTSHYPGQTCWNSGCHEAVHGSNRDRNLLKR